MFSIQQCKRYLKKRQYSEQQIGDISYSLYQLANLLVDNWLKKQDDADKQSSMVNEITSEENDEELLSIVVDIFEAEIQGRKNERNYLLSSLN